MQRMTIMKTDARASYGFSAANATDQKMRFLLCILLVCVGGCAVSRSIRRHAVENQIRRDLQVLFEQEEHLPPERDIVKLHRAKRHREEVLRSVVAGEGRKKLLPQLRELFALCERNDAVFTATVQSMVLQTGVSSVVQTVLSIYFYKIPFDFLRGRGDKLNSKYRYSRTILDYRVIYPE